MISSYGTRVKPSEHGAPHQVLVFGSNTEGRHGAGVALIAKKFYGARYGQARGLQGRSYAIVTKDLKVGGRSVSKESISREIRELYRYASAHPELEFLIGYADLGRPALCGYAHEELAELFASHPIPANVLFSESYARLISELVAQ